MGFPGGEKHTNKQQMDMLTYRLNPPRGRLNVKYRKAQKYLIQKKHKKIQQKNSLKRCFSGQLPKATVVI